jgi:hypothetical protein
MVAVHAEVLMTGGRRAELILSGTAVVVGAGGLLVARDVSFTAARGEILLGLGVSFNPLGALVTIVLAVLALAGAVAGNRVLVLAAAGGFGLATLQVILQFGRADNWLGSRGSNLSFWLALAIGLASLVWLQVREEEAS